ncbi:hypothetical protein K435DRAFT_809400 [Dendrothele bispora CBS 962.96]|uniref:Uncharacterized protein n=1 Tax=Dendrothele bispora (strain CBS 962.96) TaxID=1314807 RepID=A0A4S8KYD2_DENBC|nr:hypothetical protein K435DRAFT_809400 [Dendrothele bispora CBS 962.96]
MIMDPLGWYWHEKCALLDLLKTGKKRFVCFTVPGHLIQPLNPTLLVTSSPKKADKRTFYLFQSDVLRALAEELLNRLVDLDDHRALKIPKIDRSTFFPYWTTTGEAALLCEQDGMGHGDIDGYISCPSCTEPTIYLDISKPQSILNHIGSHTKCNIHRTLF